jgi:small neutral amino acid transporter SnatA (MarC family)
MLFVAVLAAVDPAGARLAARRSGVDLPGAILGGAVIVLVAAGVLAGAGDAIVDWLSVRPESWRIAAGIVAGFTGVRRLVSGLPPAEPRTERVPALVPMAFPIMFTPTVATLAVAGGVDVGVAITAAAFAVGLALAAAAGVVAGGGDRLWLAASRFFGAVLVVAAVALVISGIADI